MVKFCFFFILVKKKIIIGDLAIAECTYMYSKKRRTSHILKNAENFVADLHCENSWISLPFNHY